MTSGRLLGGEVAVVAVRVKSDWVGAACSASVVCSHADVPASVPVGVIVCGATEVTVALVGTGVGDTSTFDGTEDAVTLATLGMVVGGKTPVSAETVDCVGMVVAVVITAIVLFVAGAVRTVPASVLV